jgi:hypothetical protein
VIAIVPDFYVFKTQQEKQGTLPSIKAGDRLPTLVMAIPKGSYPASGKGKSLYYFRAPVLRRLTTQPKAARRLALCADQEVVIEIASWNVNSIRARLEHVTA